MNAPTGSKVTVLTKHAPVEVRVEKTIWFKWWGKEPLHEADVNAASIIEQEGLVEARIRMTNTLADGIITTITGIVGFPRRTLIVEGNRKQTLNSSTLSNLNRFASSHRDDEKDNRVELSVIPRHRNGE